ncbi:NADPH-dependent FMN reductase [Geomicrobium sp. JSM 1781026]|uniref:NADPH-dependent FMN reductase n=1 Tax=Geomicrobium sp. JSM 1781026 TaxID=3344580 RepID=UPI0035C253EE
MSVLLVSGSFKPELGVEGKSAARETIGLVKRGCEDAGAPFSYLDLREYQLPTYNGSFYYDYKLLDLKKINDVIQEHNTIVFSVPAYCCMVAGGFINFINVMCGPLYDSPDGKYIFKGKKIHLIVVGAEEEDASLGLNQLQKMFLNMGAILKSPHIIISNPRIINRKELIYKSTEAYNLGLSFSKVEVKNEQ